jgi:hypothetical protein
MPLEKLYSTKGGGCKKKKKKNPRRCRVKKRREEEGASGAMIEVQVSQLRKRTSGLKARTGGQNSEFHLRSR